MAEDDYLSDKFLQDLQSTSSAPKTYSQRRKEAQRHSKLKNEQNKLKSRHQRELESREEGLTKSLFEKIDEEVQAGLGQGSKALNIMMKMGFKPGQTLGQPGGENPESERLPPAGEDNRPSAESDKLEHATAEARPGHRTVPLPIGEQLKEKKGIGLRKRAQSPTTAERVAKLAKLTEHSSRDAFLDRTRQIYDERRAESRLNPARRTCNTLDEKAGKSFNVLWLDPNNPESFPAGLIDSLEQQFPPLQLQSGDHQTPGARLKRQMQRDALQQSVVDDDDGSGELRRTTAIDHYERDILEEAAQFLRLSAQDRLTTTLAYLRDRYAYCFWCGTQYSDQNEMADMCPGEDEEAHD